MIRDMIREDLRGYEPYKVNEIPYKAKLDANESPYNLDDKVLEKVMNWLKENENFNIYPDTNSFDLRKKLAEFWNKDVDQIICGVGSDQLIDCILRLFVEPGDKVLMPSPSFSMYELTTTINHGIPVKFDLEEDFSYTVDKIIDRYKEEKPKLLILCTPNNPTGNVISNEDIIKVLENVECPVIVDEAYAEFSNETMIDYVDEYEKLIILRTFSKAFGLAGLRVGYSIASKEMTEVINIVKPPYNLNTFTQRVAYEVLCQYEKYEEKIKTILKERDWLYKELENIAEIKVFDSQSNSILIRTTVEGLGSKLGEKGLLIRGFKKGVLKDCIRVSVGTREQNQLFIEVLKKLL